MLCQYEQAIWKIRSDLFYRCTQAPDPFKSPFGHDVASNGKWNSTAIALRNGSMAQLLNVSGAASSLHDGYDIDVG